MKNIYGQFRIAAIQAASIPFDRAGSVEKACALIEAAAEKGATLAAFGEAWLSGYPFFAFNAPSAEYWSATADYYENAIEIPSPTTDKLCRAAKRAAIDVVIGIVERDHTTQGTLYCTLLFIAQEGLILGRHRKLKATNAERAIWGDGDASGLRTHQRGYARISGLNCWEHNMVLPGYALMAQGTQVHVAAWPGREPISAPPAPISVWPRQLLLSRAFASQAACYVVLAGGIRRGEHVPEKYRHLHGFDHTGDSYIIDPRGEIIAGPADGEEIIFAEGSLEAIYAAKAACDVGGHYSRPDIFQLAINRNMPQRIVDLASPIPIHVRAAERNTDALKDSDPFSAKEERNDRSSNDLRARETAEQDRE